MNRRQLLLRGVLVAALAPAAHRAGAGNEAAPALAVVQDPAYRRSREFASLLVERGARRFTPDLDMLALWHGELSALRRIEGGLRLAGLTTWSDFLVLRDCAGKAGLAPLSIMDPDAGAARPARATLHAWLLGTVAQRS